MTYDPREEKLPKWARALLDKERLNADLRWPSEPEPKPLERFSGDMVARSHLRSRTVFLIFGLHGAIVETRWIDDRGYFCRPLGGHASRPIGTVYATKKEALLAAWWRECRASARAIHNQAQAYRECEA